MIYKNNKTINEWYFNDAELIKVYKNGAICYYKIVQGATPSQEPCFAVVDNIQSYSDTEFVDVYDKATEKWYKLNNLDQYEEYGVYGEGRNITYYEGKLTIDNGYEYEWDGSEWVSLGEVSGGTAPLPDGYTEVEYVGSNGTAYINTGLQLMDTVGNTFSIEGRVWTEYYVTNDGFGYLMSTESTTSPFPGFTWRWNHLNNNVLEFGYNGANATLNTVDEGDGTSGFTVSSNGTSKTNNNIPFSLFAGLNGSSPWRFSKSNYYDELKITKNNQVVADYIPCQRDSDNKYGFYDLVSESFITSSNNNLLLGGDTASEYPKYYTEKDEPENNVVFTDMTEALAYECPWVGMRAIIGGDRYIFTSGYTWEEDTSTVYATLQELAQTHTVVQVGTNKYTLEPTISGITFFRLNMNNYGTSGYFIDLYRENLDQTNYFGIKDDSNGSLYKAIDGYRTIKDAANSSSCTWAYWIDQNTIEVNVVDAVQDTIFLGFYTNGVSMSFISFPIT